MALPDLIEIVPPVAGGRAHVTIPGSKSITNRALILAALGRGETVLRGALWSDDTEVMVEALRTLGFDVTVEPDASEAANRTIRVQGRGGDIPNAGSDAAPLSIVVGNAGTAARFLMAFVALGRGVYYLHGVERMHSRPQRALIDALRQLGYRVEDGGRGCLPVTIYGAGAKAGACRVGIEESSQFASALLLSSRVGGWTVEVTGEDAEESAYVAMTSKLMRVFPEDGGEFQVEPDCSSASYFLAAGAIVPGLEVEVANWPESDWQIDGRFVEFVQRFRGKGNGTFAPLSRLDGLGDAIMTAIAIAPLLSQPSRFEDLGRLRVQESERVYALRKGLESCGAKVIEDGDTLEVWPSHDLHGAEIETFDDHRLAMCFATLGLRVPGIRIQNPACVGKTFPNFFAKLAAPLPDGLGVTVLDPTSGRVLQGADLLAEDKERNLAVNPVELPSGPPLVTVLSGFSGSGKDAIRDLLMRWQLPAHFVVTATNRAMRPGEVEGVDYLFVSDEEFDRMERDGELIEHAIVYGQKKGVPRRQVLDPLAAGRDVLARVDVQGAATLRSLIPDALLIFIAPPSLEEASRRLTDRDTDSEEQRRVREATAREEQEASRWFDHVVINETGKLEDTARRVIELIRAEKARRAAAP